jgi:hypothetical protein
VVYAKKPFAGPEVLLKYLTRYTHRVALSNGRLKRVDGDRVTLTYKDYAAGCQAKEMTLAGPELLRRFALHVLPKGFVRVRQCGILAHRDRRERLELCRRLLGVPAPPCRLNPPAPLPCEAIAINDRIAVELPMPTSAALPATEPNTTNNSSLPAILLLTLALSCDAWGWLLACACSTSPQRRCPSCGQGELQTIWEQPRPRGAHGQSKDPWNTS